MLIDSALATSLEALDRLIATTALTGPAWAIPPAPGKWSASQIVEHVARWFDASVHVAQGQPTGFPRLPAVLHPVLRTIFRQIQKRGALPKGKTSKAFNPVEGPATLADGRARLEAAHDRYETARRELSARREPMRTPMLARVPVEAFVRVMELHARHHSRQIVRAASQEPQAHAQVIEPAPPRGKGVCYRERGDDPRSRMNRGTKVRRTTAQRTAQSDQPTTDR